MEGARVQDIKRRVKQGAEEMEDGTMLVIQDGGNSEGNDGSSEGRGREEHECSSSWCDKMTTRRNPVQEIEKDDK